MRRRHFGLMLIAATLLRPAAGRAGGAADSAGGFIRQVGHDLPGVVGDAASEAEKRRRLEPFLARVVDVAAVARFCLGRYWRQATPAQQQDFRGLFLRVLANAVASRVGAYGAGAGPLSTSASTSPPTSQVTVLAELDGPDGIRVPTIVQTGTAAPARVTWLVERAPAQSGAGAFRILDVEAEGMSLRLSLRSDYTSFISRNGGNLDLFLRTLRAHTP